MKVPITADSVTVLKATKRDTPAPSIMRNTSERPSSSYPSKLYREFNEGAAKICSRLIWLPSKSTVHAIKAKANHVSMMIRAKETIMHAPRYEDQSTLAAHL